MRGLARILIASATVALVGTPIQARAQGYNIDLGTLNFWRLSAGVIIH